MNMTNSEMRTGKNRNTGLCNAPADRELDHEKTSRQRIKTRVSTSTKLYQRDTAEKIIKILLNRFNSGVQGHQAMMRFEKRRQRDERQVSRRFGDAEKA